MLSIVGEAVGEVLVLLIAAAVHERQHRNRGDLPGGRRLGLPALQDAPQAAQLVRHVERRLGALPRVLLQAAADDPLEIAGEIGAHARQRRWRLVQNRRAHHHRRRSRERAASGEQLVQ
jgi:hypothetical protein